MGNPRGYVWVAAFLLVAALAGCSGVHGAAGMDASAKAPSFIARIPVVGRLDTAGKPPIPSSAVRPPEADPAATDRLMVYTADLTVLVDNVDAVRSQLQTLIESMGGYLQAMEGHVVTFKVPAPLLDDALAAIEATGEVTARTILGRDVTEEMRDLRIRLDNSEMVRQRLVDLLEKADNVEDALKVEKELERVTEQVELLKGKIQYLENKVAFSTVIVRLNSPVPDQGVETRLPFDWVYSLGEDLLRGRTGRTFTDQAFWWRRVKFDVPRDYVRYYERGYLTRAMSGNGVYLRVERQPNTDEAEGEFWATTVRGVLGSHQAIRVRDEEEVARKRGGPPVLCLWGEKQLGRKRFGYVIGLLARPRHVVVFEAWGPADAFERDRPKLKASMASIR